MKKKLLIAIIALVLLVGLLVSCDDVVDPSDTPVNLAHDTLIIERQGSDYVVTGVKRYDFTELVVPDFVTRINGGILEETTWYENQPEGLIYAGKFVYKHKGEILEDTSITIKDGTLGIVDYAFSYGPATMNPNIGLTDVVIPEGVKYIGYEAFYGCSRLVNVSVPDSVDSIGSGALFATAWYNNQPDGLVYAGKVAYKYKGTMPKNSSITLKKGTLGITGRAFINCDELVAITIPDSVTSIGYEAFSYCNGLTSITIPDSVTSIDYLTFCGCENLTDINIPDSVTRIGFSAFSGTALYDNQPDGLVYAGKVAYEYKGEMSENTSITLKEGSLSIADYAFRGCSGLTSITIPESVTSIGNYAFYDCSGLTNITIPNSVTSIGRSAFSGCSALESITVEKCNRVYYSEDNCLIETASKTLIAGCKNNIIPADSNVTSIGYEAFSHCIGLTSITIPENVTSIDTLAFYDCTELKTVIIDSSEISKLNYSNSNLLDYAETVYVKEELEVGSYITDSFTLAESSDKDGYVKYTKN